MNTFTARFNEYVARCYPNGVKPGQHEQLRQAFVAGVLESQLAAKEACSAPNREQAEAALTKLQTDIQVLVAAILHAKQSRN